MPDIFNCCIVGLHMISAHAGGGFEPLTVGVYAKSPSGITVGVLRNSEGRASAYAANTFETADRRFAVSFGAITGYRAATLSPMVVPSIRFGIQTGLALRFAYVPKPRTSQGSSALHIAIEIDE